MQTMRRIALPLILLLCTTALRADEKEIIVRLVVPDAAWSLSIDEVHQVGKELWIISTVSRDPEMMGAQAISTIQATLRTAVPDLPAKYFVIGKTWGWKNEEPYTFIRDLKQIEKELRSGTLLYKRVKKD